MDILPQSLKELETEFDEKTQEDKIHIRIQSRTTRKTQTLVEGVDPNVINLKRFVQCIQKLGACNGTIFKNGVLQFSGDQRNLVAKELKQRGISSELINMHGY